MHTAACEQDNDQNRENESSHAVLSVRSSVSFPKWANFIIKRPVSMQKRAKNKQLGPGRRLKPGQCFDDFGVAGASRQNDPVMLHGFRNLSARLIGFGQMIVSDDRTGIES